jgi:branched-chain amino acid transport system permease protein
VATVEATQALPAVGREYSPTPTGLIARAFVALLIGGLVFALPLFTNLVWDDRISLAAIYAIIGLSINVITGYAGQISLGHQAFVGIGAFMSGFMVGPVHASFIIAVPVAGLVGALLAFALGLIALRISGLYLALVTLTFGLMAQSTIFNWRSFTGGGAGRAAPRPSAFQSNEAYAYLCLLVLGLFLLIDWRLAKSRAGRAIVAVRNNERVAATLGINVTAYKLFAFVVSGFIAGIAGSLFAHHTQSAYANDFQLQVALLWVIMTVVGGLGSRAGVVIGSAFFALFPELLAAVKRWLPFIKGMTTEKLAVLAPLVGAVLLLLTLTLYPGGIGQQLLPIRRWLAGGRFIEPKHRDARAAEEAQVAAEAEEGPLFQPTHDQQTARMAAIRDEAVAAEAQESSGGDVVEGFEDPSSEQTTKIPPVPPEQRRGLRAFRKDKGGK